MLDESHRDSHGCHTIKHVLISDVFVLFLDLFAFFPSSSLTLIRFFCAAKKILSEILRELFKAHSDHIALRNRFFAFFPFFFSFCSWPDRLVPCVRLYVNVMHSRTQTRWNTRLLLGARCAWSAFHFYYYFSFPFFLLPLLRAGSTLLLSFVPLFGSPD